MLITAMATPYQLSQKIKKKQQSSSNKADFSILKGKPFWNMGQTRAQSATS